MLLFTRNVVLYQAFFLRHVSQNRQGHISCDLLVWKTLFNLHTFGGWHHPMFDNPRREIILQTKTMNGNLWISRSSKLSLDYPDTFLNHLDTFKIVQKLSRSPRHISRSSRLFLDYLDTFSRISGHCLDRTETFQIVHTLFRLSGHIFYINRTLLGSSGKFQDYPDTLLDHPDSF